MDTKHYLSFMVQKMLSFMNVFQKSRVCQRMKKSHLYCRFFKLRVLSNERNKQSIITSIVPSNVSNHYLNPLRSDRLKKSRATLENEKVEDCQKFLAVLLKSQ